MAKKNKNDDRRVNPTAPRPIAVSPPTRQPATPNRERAATVTRSVSVQPGPTAAQRAASNVAQRNIQDARNAAYGRAESLSRVPASIAKPALDTAAKVDAKKIEDTAKPRPRMKSRLTLNSLAQTHTKPERRALRSPEKVRAIIKCKSRPKNKSRPSGSGGGGKRFIPWC